MSLVPPPSPAPGRVPGPCRTISAICASVSALWTSAGRFSIRRAVLLSVRKSGQGHSPVDEVHQRRFLTGHKAVRWPYDGFAHSGVAGRTSLGDGLRHHSCDAVAVDGDTDHNPRRSAQRSQILCSVEHQVRGPRQEQLVLVAGRLALHAVHQQRSAIARGACDGELDGRGKAAPTPPRQPGLLDARRQGVLPRRAAPEPYRQGTVCLDVAGEITRLAEQAMHGALRWGLAHARRHVDLLRSVE